jgi:hypothetical protein
MQRNQFLGSGDRRDVISPNELKSSKDTSGSVLVLWKPTLAFLKGTFLGILGKESLSAHVSYAKWTSLSYDPGIFGVCSF